MNRGGRHGPGVARRAWHGSCGAHRLLGSEPVAHLPSRIAGCFPAKSKKTACGLLPPSPARPQAASSRRRVSRTSSSRPPRPPGRSGRAFAQWLSETWAQVVDHPDAEQKARHRLAGTAIDVRNGLRACDPKRLAIYFTKHSSPNIYGHKEYQHIVPELWRGPGRGPGRFWGVYGLKKALTAVEVPQDAYIAARRIVRRWSRSQAVYGDSGSRFPTSVVPRTATRLVTRIIRGTGVVAHRRVRRRRTLCNQGGLAGGYALVNDGPAFASCLAKALRPISPRSMA